MHFRHLSESGWDGEHMETIPRFGLTASVPSAVWSAVHSPHIPRRAPARS